MTKKVNTPFIAYCDQDDIWMPNKLETLRAFFDVPNTTLAFSDMKVINEKSEIIAQHIQEVRPRQILCWKRCTFSSFSKEFCYWLYNDDAV